MSGLTAILLDGAVSIAHGTITAGCPVKVLTTSGATVASIESGIIAGLPSGYYIIVTQEGSYKVKL